MSSKVLDPQWRKILVFDPGGTTGWALFTRTADERFRLVDYGQFETFTEIGSRIWFADHIVYEHVVQHNGKLNPVGIEVQGVINYFCWLEKKTSTPRGSVFMRAPYTYAKTFLHSIVEEHARDAVAHGLSFIGVENIEGVFNG